MPINASAKFKRYFQISWFIKQAKKLSYRRCVKKRETCFIFYFPPPNGCRRRNLFFLVANCQHGGDRNQLVRRSTVDLHVGSAHGQPARCLARPTKRDDDLEDIRWINGLEGGSLSAASYGILPTLKKLFFLPFETDGDVLSSVFLCKRAAKCFLLYAWSAPAT